MEAEEEVEMLRIFKQPIFEPDDTENGGLKVNGYEILLRGMGQDLSFPANTFKNLIKNNQSNATLLSWLESKLKKIFQADTHFEYAINLDPQQLTYESTFEFLARMAAHKHQLVIEVTETLPLSRKIDDYFDYSLGPFLKRVKLLGYKVVLDDVSSGINSLNMMWQCSDYVSRVKLSIFYIAFGDVQLAKKVIELWNDLSQKMEMEFVIEGVESEELRDWILNNTKGFQQGFGLACPSELN